MRLTVISDGSNNGTKVVDLDTGIEVEGVVSVDTSFAVEAEPVAVIKVFIGTKESHVCREPYRAEQVYTRAELAEA